MNRSLGGAMGYAGYGGDWSRVPAKEFYKMLRLEGPMIGGRKNPDGTFDLRYSGLTRPPVKTIWDW
tara:strand:+ start:4108 stop:4305 length:198 start_codon:yes stop_codon:yes gene_type:complete